MNRKVRDSGLKNRCEPRETRQLTQEGMTRASCWNGYHCWQGGPLHLGASFPLYLDLPCPDPAAMNTYSTSHLSSLVKSWPQVGASNWLTLGHVSSLLLGGREKCLAPSASTLEKSLYLPADSHHGNPLSPWRRGFRPWIGKRSTQPCYSLLWESGWVLDPWFWDERKRW